VGMGLGVTTEQSLISQFLNLSTVIPIPRSGDSSDSRPLPPPRETAEVHRLSGMPCAPARAKVLVDSC